ncbi:MAG: hypothetical protein JST75_00210 [Bacteroidetes bacterium]|nr:hypothetical protein [Bacteroidota bacterium]
MSKRISWWYFLFWTGFFIPSIYRLLAKVDFKLVFFRSLVSGLNPNGNFYLSIILNLLAILIFIIGFIILDKIKINIHLKSILYVLIGILFISFIVLSFMPPHFDYAAWKKSHHHYYALDIDTEQTNNSGRYYYLVAHIFIIIIFLYFFIRNFPLRFRKR